MTFVIIHELFISMLTAEIQECSVICCRESLKIIDCPQQNLHFKIMF